MTSPDGNHIDPAVLRDLQAVDAALAGEPVDPALAEVAELAVALRDVRPRPRAEFQSRLGAAAAAGFQRPGADAARATLEHGSRRRSLRPGPFARRWRAAPLIAGSAACALLVAVAVLSSGGGTASKPETGIPGSAQTTPASGGGAAAKARPAKPAVPSAGGVQSHALPAPSPATRIAPRARSRAVERAASLTLAPAPESVEDVADRVIEVTDRYQGFVLRSTVSAGDSRSAGGQLELRIPATRLQPALRDLSALAHVRSRTQNTEDVTSVVVSRRAHLAEKLAERQGLLRQLARATTANETASIRLRLRLVNRALAQARARLAALRNRVSYAAVAVELRPDGKAARPHGSGSGKLGRALDDARDVLETALAVVLVSLAVILPLSILGVAGVGAMRWLTRVRRERALDDAA